MKYMKVLDQEKIVGVNFLIMEDREIEAGINGICSFYDPELIKIDTNINIQKGETIVVRRKENGRFVFSRKSMRIFIPIDEFLKIKTLQAGDLIQFGKEQIGTVIGIYNADNIWIKICRRTTGDLGENNGETTKIGIDDISTVASPKMH